MGEIKENPLSMKSGDGKVRTGFGVLDPYKVFNRRTDTFIGWEDGYKDYTRCAIELIADRLDTINDRLAALEARVNSKEAAQ